MTDPGEIALHHVALSLAGIGHAADLTAAAAPARRGVRWHVEVLPPRAAPATAHTTNDRVEALKVLAGVRATGAAARLITKEKTS